MNGNCIEPVHVIGGGLAGSEAAWQLAQADVPVVLHEMRSVRRTEAHKTDRLAELVCSNSFRSDDALNNAVGLLHEDGTFVDAPELATERVHVLQRQPAQPSRDVVLEVAAVARARAPPTKTQSWPSRIPPAGVESGENQNARLRT